MIDQILNEADLYVAKIEESARASGRNIPCRAGCFFCCKEVVIATEAEARFIVDGIPSDQLDEVKAKVAAWLKKVRESDLLDEFEPDAVFWRSMNAWCPLLKDGLCSVYSRRPFACRAHIAVGAVEGCSNDALRARQKYVYSPEISAKVAIKMNEIGPEGQRYDHLGVWLARILLGETVDSKGAFMLRITDEAPPSPKLDSVED